MFLIFQIFNIHIVGIINYVFKKDGPSWNKIMQIIYKILLEKMLYFSYFWLLEEIFERSNLREEIYILPHRSCSFLSWSVDSVVIQPALSQNILKYKGKPLKSLQLGNIMENKKAQNMSDNFQTYTPWNLLVSKSQYCLMSLFQTPAQNKGKLWICHGGSQIIRS